MQNKFKINSIARAETLFLAFFILFLVDQKDSICDRTWRANYNQIELINIWWIRNHTPMSSHDLRLNCDGTFLYTNTCGVLKWEGCWTYSKDHKSIDLLSNTNPSRFPRTYVIKNGKLISKELLNDQWFDEILKPTKD